MRIALIHTGGTIATAPGPGGLAPRAGLVEALVEEIATGMPGVEVTLRILDPLLDSSALGPTDWTRLAGLVAEDAGHADAVVMTHGTDTLAYTAAALDLMAPAQDKPVVLTGSMRPPGADGSDARDNLALALATASEGTPGVTVAFAGHRLRADRIVKRSAEALDAFVEGPGPAAPGTRPKPSGFVNRRIATLTLTPGMAPEILAAQLAPLDSAVIRVFGSGTAPPDPGIGTALSEAAANGIRLALVSQCAEGAADPATYAAGAGLRDLPLAVTPPTTEARAFVELCCEGQGAAPAAE